MADVHFEEDMDMRRVQLAVIAGALFLSASAQAQQTVSVAAVAAAMGATGLNSIAYSGSGFVFGFGQAYLPGERWPRFIQRSYKVDAHYDAPALRFDIVRSQGEHPPHGGAAQPVAADQRTVQVVSGPYAWSEGETR